MTERTSRLVLHLAFAFLLLLAVLEEPTRQLLVESIFARSKYGEVPPSLQLEDEG